MPINIFDLDNPAARAGYARWRDAKLAAMPITAEAVTVDVRDPRALSVTERAALGARLTSANMAIYASNNRDEDKAIPMALARQFGLTHLDGNWLADEDKISRITVDTDGAHPRYIPYTAAAMNWHTDGYYNDLTRPICGMLLHCVRAARDGGDNSLIDHELAYIHMREHSVDFIRAMMAADAMTIPARDDDDGVARAEVAGPVFSRLRQSGRLHMRYTARSRSIAWKNDAVTGAAVAWLQQFFAAPDAPKIGARLTPGMGLLCANVLHNRSAFEDDPSMPRLLYRARYLDEINTAVFAQPLRRHECPAL